MQPVLPEQQNSARPCVWSAQQLTKKKKPSEPHRFTPAKGLSSKFHFWGPKLLFQSQFSLCGSVLLPQGTPGLMSRRGSALRWDRALFLLLIIARIGDFLLLLFFWIFSCITCLKQQASQRCALHVATQPLTKQTRRGQVQLPPTLPRVCVRDAPTKPLPTKRALTINPR